ncbi:MAG: hypothetical protein IT328_27575 [Caldilineaceae bacterium]|nr:hypothetical protein [Caldilineaceae bacterium]
MVAGIFFMIVGLFHPIETLLSVPTPRWIIVHSLASAMSFFGVLGMTGLYVRQVKETGWLGLAGFLLLSLWLVLQAPFTFAEATILPLLVTESPAFVEGFLGIFSGYASEVSLGVLPTLWTLTGPLYILGGLLFGIATFRAAVLSRWAGGLLAVASALTLTGALLPHEFKALVAVPVGLALAWMGYALWSERRKQSPEPVLSARSPQLRQAEVQ